MSEPLSLTPIGVIHSCFREKFGTPRQPGLVNSAEGLLELFPPYSDPLAVRGLEGFSHLWVVFLFDQADTQWRPSVRPPRLGGNDTMGVFATRSPFRPNRLGLSVVELVDVQYDGAKARLRVRGLDIVDGSPLIDIKPYLPYVDAIPGARSGFAPDRPEANLEVTFDQDAERTLADMDADEARRLRALVTDVLREDPRPAYQRKEGAARIYGVRLERWNIRWQVDGKQVRIINIDPVPDAL